MAITAGDSPTWSYRSAGPPQIALGQTHWAGARGVDATRYTAVEDHLRAHWDVEEITHRWSAQDPSPYDHAPMIGTYTPVSSRMFVATGYAKWGLTSGTMAAVLLTDRIAGDRTCRIHRYWPPSSRPAGPSWPKRRRGCGTQSCWRSRRRRARRRCDN